MDSKLAAAFQEFFASTTNIVGHEFNYQALLTHFLKKYFPDFLVVREYSQKELFSGSIDVAVLIPSSMSPRYVFEIKGGAYASRNALRDTFSKGGYCKDYDKLEAVSSNCCESWMVAIDALELGRGIGPQKLNQVVYECENRELGLAYYGSGDRFGTVVARGEMKETISLIGSYCSDDSISTNSVLNKLHSDVINKDVLLGKFVGKEADIVGHIYSKLLDMRLSPKQVALDAYFGFAPRNGQALQRPDISIFESDVDGHFNLYPNGDTTRSYDSLKLKTLRCLIEIKGGGALNGYLKDLQKLNEWRQRVSDSALGKSIDLQHINYIFVAVDQRRKGLSTSQQEDLYHNADRNSVNAYYFHLPRE